MQADFHQTNKSRKKAIAATNLAKCHIVIIYNNKNQNGDVTQ